MTFNKKKKKDNIFKKYFNKIKKVYHKNVTNNKNKFNITETIVFMLVTFAFGLIIGGVIMYGKGTFSSNSSLHEFAKTYNEIVNSYYQEVDADKLLESGISGMINYLGDPYSTYMSKDDAETFNEDVEGIYYGIGAEIKYSDDLKNVLIGRVFDSSPASKAGIKTDDILLKVNGESIEKMSLSKIASIVKGEKKTNVVITVLRNGEEKEFTIKRDAVDNISVNGKIIEKDDKKIGYLAISIFASNTYDQFEKELTRLEEEGIDALIIDVRGNSGGYLTTVTNIISLFTKKGDVIYQLKTKDKVDVICDETKEERNYKIAVLTNSGSASASEVLTGALKETYKAKVVGTKTFGKGKVQKVYALSNGAMVKYTYQEWLTPNGNYIDKEGITPDVEIKYEYNKDGKDNQLEKAIEVILEK